MNRLPPPRVRDRFAAALEMWRDYLLAGLPPAHPRPVGPVEPVGARFVFVITSVIRPPRPVIAYRWPRSVFDSGERLQQTLGTIESIRAQVPDAAIVLIEGSSLHEDEWAELAVRVERPLRIDHDPRAARLRDSLSRAAGEAYMLLAVQALLEASAYELAIKISGRYRLSDSFTVDRLPRDRIALRKLQGNAARDPRYRRGLPRDRILLSRVSKNVHSTRVYSVPKDLRELWERQLRRALRAGLRGWPLESSLVRGLPPDSYVSLEKIGLRGQISASGRTVDE